MDKSRAAAASHSSVNSTTNTSTTHNTVLGKSVDGLNIIQHNNNNNHSSNQKKSLKAAGNHSMAISRSQHCVNDMDRSCNSSNSTIKAVGTVHQRLKNGSDRFIRYDKENDVDDFDEFDDDDNGEKTGCFSFISRSGDDSYTKRKKHSFDSKMAEQSLIQTVPVNALHIAIGANAYAQDIGADEDVNDDSVTDSNVELRVSQQPLKDDVTYDRNFYRAIQKSLDDIFSRDDYNEQFASQKSRNSKSSGDLTMFDNDDESYGQYRFRQFDGESKFRRECFFATHNDDDESSNDVDTTTTATSTNHELDEKISERLNYYQQLSSRIPNDQTHSASCSDEHSSSVDISMTTPSASRKSSVTFRVDNNSFDDTQSSPAVTQSTTELFYANIDQNSIQHSIGDASAELTTTILPKSPMRYAMIANPQSPSPQNLHNVNVANGATIPLKSVLLKKERKEKSTQKSKYKTLTGFLKFPKKKSVLHSNSFYNKYDQKTEMNEQLLDEDDKCGSHASNGSEPKYDSIYRSKNFVIAKQNES